MKLLKFFQFAYLFIAAMFLYKGISEYSVSGTIDYLSFVFAVLAIGMFFFRRHFRNKFEDRNS